MANRYIDCKVNRYTGCMANRYADCKVNRHTGIGPERLSCYKGIMK